MDLRALLLPEPPRRPAHGRAWNVAWRTAHLAVVGVLLGGHVFNVPPHLLVGWLWAAILTGGALMLLEAYATLDWFMQVGGLCLLLKLALLVLIYFQWHARVPILFTVVAIAGISSHMPGRFRHYSLYYRRNMKGQPRVG
jgi:hypothetical protein